MSVFKFMMLIVACGMLGALIVSLGVHTWCAITSPRMLGDGQYGMIFMLTFPIGWLIGAAVFGAWVFAGAESELPPHAGWVFAGVYVVGLIVMPITAVVCLPILILFMWPIEWILRLFGRGAV